MSKYRDEKGLVYGMFALPVAALVLLTGASLAGPSEYEIEKARLADYCQAVDQWNDMGAQGVAPERRYGHPDYAHKAHLCNEYAAPHGGELAAR